MGPLTFFENWFEKTKPNAEWIARYLGEDLGHDQRKAKAAGILANAQEFLERSARKHAVTRTVMRYGPRKIAAVLAVLVMVGLGSFALKTYLDRRNVAVLEDIRQQSVGLSNNPKLYFTNRAIVVVEQLRSGVTTIPDAIAQVNDPLEKIVLANGIAAALVFEGRTEPAREIKQVISITDSLIKNYQPNLTNGEPAAKYLKELNEWARHARVSLFLQRYRATDASPAAKRQALGRSGHHPVGTDAGQL